MQTLITIAPIFILIALGWGAARIGFFPDEILAPVNRLIYYFAIPAFLFHAISNFPLAQGFNVPVTLITLGSAAVFYVSGWLLGKASKLPPQQSGVLVQASCHGNLGYIGLPIAFYFLGDAGLAQAGIISGFLMILQNVLSVSVLQSFSSSRSANPLDIFTKLLKNPVIVSCMAGITASGFQIPIPEVLNRTLSMLGDLAPPAALLLIGASLSFQSVRAHKRLIVGALLCKLFLLPAFGLLIFSLFHLPLSEYLPALILLATPTATVAYVMVKQIGADTGLAVTAISASTLISAVSLPLWLALLSG